jgi:hypothetical protein
LPKIDILEPFLGCFWEKTTIGKQGNSFLFAARAVSLFPCFPCKIKNAPPPGNKETGKQTGKQGNRETKIWNTGLNNLSDNELQSVS